MRETFMADPFVSMFTERTVDKLQILIARTEGEREALLKMNAYQIQTHVLQMLEKSPMHMLLSVEFKFHLAYLVELSINPNYERE